MALDRGQSGTSLGGRVTVGHTRRPHDNQGARLQKDQFLTQELTWFVLDTGEPGNGNPYSSENGDHPNANIYNVGYEANGDPRPGEKIINVLSSFMNPVIVEAIDIELGEGTTDALQQANARGNTRLLYFACEVDGLHWSSENDANGNAYDTYGAITASTDETEEDGTASAAARALRAIQAIDSTDLGSAKLSRGYMRVCSNNGTATDATLNGIERDNSID